MSWKVIIPEMFRVGTIELHTSKKKLLKRMRKQGINVEDGYMDHCAGACVYTHLESKGVLYVLVADGRVTTLMHELFHVAIRYLAYVGVPVETNAPNETYAYFLEYLVGEFLPLLPTSGGTP